MDISSNHKNRRLHNWLIYKINDQFLLKYKKLYKGILYDLGCGEKPYEKFFKNYVDEYIGIDWGSSLHDLKADIIADLNNRLDLNNNIADTVISLSVIEHLANPYVFIEEAYRILKPNGNLILQVPFQWHIHEEPFDYQRFTKYGLLKLFQDAGFKEITVNASNGFFTTLTLKINYFTKRFVRGPRLLKLLITIILFPIWTINQITAPFLDKLDLVWEKETAGYWVTAKK